MMYSDTAKNEQAFTKLNAPSTPDGQIGRAYSEDGLLNHIFSYHSPTSETLPKYAALREAARHFAKTILMNVPPGADRTLAIVKVREAVMTANAGVALDGVSF